MHNAVSYIEDTLTSMARQTVPPQEVIVVDDASTDGSADVVQAFRFCDGTAPTLIRNPARVGVAMSRNRGVFSARGNLIGLCDNDDLWHPRRIEVVLQAFERHPEAHSVATDATGFALQRERVILESHQRGALVSHWVSDDDVETLRQCVGEFDSYPERNVTFSDLQQDGCFVTTQVCFRREIYAMAGGCAPWCNRADDWVLHASAALLGPIVVISRPLVFYRVHAQSQSHEDSQIARTVLAVLLALRLGGEEPDPRPAGPIYAHLIGSAARNGLSFSQVLAFAALGEIGTRRITTVLRAYARSRRTAGSLRKHAGRMWNRPSASVG